MKKYWSEYKALLFTTTMRNSEKFFEYDGKIPTVDIS
jgi:hypothetical protein